MRAANCCVLLLVCASLGFAQTVTGSIVGSVHDPGGLAVAGARVNVHEVSTGADRQALTNDRGDFAFTALAAGQYNLSVTMDGFKTFQRNGVMLPMGERLSVGDLALEVGSLTDKITVTAEGAIVQTVSGERSGLVTSGQIDNLLIRGRNVMSLLGLMPGVVDEADSDALTRNWTMNVNGGPPHLLQCRARRHVRDERG